MFSVYDWYAFFQGAMTIITVQVIVYGIYRFGVMVGREQTQAQSADEQ